VGINSKKWAQNTRKWAQISKLATKNKLKKEYNQGSQTRKQILVPSFEGNIRNYLKTKNKISLIEKD
jgi:hypothetical protein